MSKLRVAVVGVGHLGRFHAQKYRALDTVELVGVCDVDAINGRAFAQTLKTSFFADHRALLGKVDAVTIAASTSAHFELARFFLEHDVHVLVEKPMTRTSAEAAVLTELADRRGLKLQVGHVERFNPALLSARQSLTTVRFIECHRLAPFKVRGADVNVVLDLMIHDLDVILSLVDAKPVNVSAVGIAVLTDDVDIANARIEFANGAVANVTASRVSMTAQRKFRVFQPNQYVSIDFGEGEVRRVRKQGEWREGQTALQEESWNLDKGDALLAETKAFVDAIRNDLPCEVSGLDGLAALQLAETIIAAIERRPDQIIRPSADSS
ncbi:MAG TPA: Gfo/Idh/MocA family oxidoreductase [Gammaproteobacteria bacterium]|nr:Gfo/Idh/MocA family oxidoreductase [Gammaproteobacteria bacterium]